MSETYLAGWEGARMAFWDATLGTPAYVPIACITSRSEANTTNTTEKVNVCTQGKVVTTANSVTSTVSLSGEVVTADSLDDLRVLQDSLAEQTFRVYRGSGTTNPVYFVGTITNLNAEYPTGEGEDATFSMDVTINGDYLTVDPKA